VCVQTVPIAREESDSSDIVDSAEGFVKYNLDYFSSASDFASLREKD